MRSGIPIAAHAGTHLRQRLSAGPERRRIGRCLRHAHGAASLVVHKQQRCVAGTLHVVAGLKKSGAYACTVSGEAVPGGHVRVLEPGTFGAFREASLGLAGAGRTGRI